MLAFQGFVWYYTKACAVMAQAIKRSSAETQRESSGTNALSKGRIRLWI